MPINITVRNQLIGGVSDFCLESKLRLLANPAVLVELIVTLARYQEEGVQLRPAVYLTDDMSRLMGMLPDGEQLKLGHASVNVQGLHLALKKAAPLAAAPWAIYLFVKNNELMEYGLFRGASTPLAVPTDDILLERSQDMRVVKAFCLADECVEVKSTSGALHRIFLDHRSEDGPPPMKHIDDLVFAITSTVDASLRDVVAGFIGTFLRRALAKSHGALIAVVTEELPDFLSGDATLLESPIDLTSLVAALQRRDIDSSVIESWRVLAEGMFQSDGIVVFDRRGRIYAYNCFVQVEAGTVVGGARKRAYSALASKVGGGLAAAFMQSQDGSTNFAGENI